MKKLRAILATVAAAVIMFGCAGLQTTKKVDKIPVFNVRQSIEETDVDIIDEMFDNIEEKGFKHVIIDIHSPGASIFVLNYMLNRMDKLKEQGVIIETRVESAALSGGFMIFMNGTKGYRKCAKNSLFLMHTIQRPGTWGSSPITDPQQLVEKLLMDDFLKRIKQLTGLSMKRTKELILSGKDFWISGQGMLERGWADEEL
jgi:ATP-dependent protease ClpP protease subunit